MSGTFETRLKDAARRTDAELDRRLGATPREGETTRPARLLEAMRYAVLGPGKRLRPFLLIESAALFAADGPEAVRAAAALECIHAYSLVHDDLPAMDDDDLRRGRPTLHRAYDEATAILAGDALLTIAFDIAADASPALVAPLARAAGIGGMAGGQMLDLAAEGRRLDEAKTVTLQAMKTGALFRFAAEAGAILGNAPPAERQRMIDFGRAFGRAFQLADDLIDATGDAAAAGKATAKDAARGKATLVALHGIAGARVMLAEMVDEAVALLAPFGPRAAVLAEAARFVAVREG
jgi:farnesyl diphosphate synthase